MLLSFLPFFFHHLSRERNALGAVERERESATSERREPGGRGSERERERDPLSRGRNAEWDIEDR